ncbi:MAG: hypothetical protein IJM83_05065 [Firmicutes bacterium]|nr:hypothetical protein [Bacillota bacterium]
MSKKIISIVLCLAILLGIIPPIKASAYMPEEKPEYIQGQFEYRMEGEDRTVVHKMDAVLENNTDIYVSAEDAAKLAGFSVKHITGKYTFYRPGEEIWSTLLLTMTENGECRNGQLIVPYYDDPSGNRWYGLVHLLYYLRAQFVIDKEGGEKGEDEVAVIFQAEAKDLLTVMEDFEKELNDLRLDQSVLYISGGAAATTLEASFSVVCDGGFDARIFLGIIGANMIVEEQYQNALLTLAAENSEYIVNNDENELLEILESLHYDLSDPWTAEMVSIGGIPNDMIEWMNMLDGSEDFPAKVIATQLDITEETLQTFDHLSTAAEVIGDMTEAISAFYNYMDVAERSKGWKESFVKGLELLTEIEKKDFHSNDSIDRLKKAATNLFNEYKDPIKAAEDAVWAQGAAFFGKKAMTLMGPAGALFGILDSCIGIATAIFDEEVQAGKTTYMVDCLMDVGNAANKYLSVEISKAEEEARNKGYVSQKTLDRIRAWAIMAVRVTQRTYAYVYSLEKTNDKNFENTEKAKMAREVMTRALGMMSVITESEKYDKNLMPLSGANSTSMLSNEPLQRREDISESTWRTCYVGGEVLDDETDEPIMDARIDVYRSDNPDVVFAGASTDNAGHWDIKLDNRYDYTFVFKAEDEEHVEYQITYEGTSVEEIDAKENYVYFYTRMSKGLEELFYAYLRANVVPKIGTCDGASFSTPLGDKAMGTNGGTGLLSALVDDLDNDGSLEMVTVTVSVRNNSSNEICYLVFESDRPIVAVDIDLYELVDGKDGKEVVHADGPRNIGYMETESYGSIGIYACQWEGITYFYGGSVMDDMTTYGPHATAIYHPEEGKLTFDFVAGGTWGQGLPGTDDNERMGARKMDLTNTIFDSNVKSHLEKISALNFELTDSSYKNATVKVTITDMTYLLEALEKDYKTIRDRAKEFLALLDENEKKAKAEIEENIQKLEAAMNSAAGQTARQIIDYISSTSGKALTMTYEDASDDGSYTAAYKTDDKAQVHIKVNADGKIEFLTTEARDFHQTEEWIALKDAILTVAALGLPQDAISAFSGELAMQSYDEVYNGYEILVHNIDNFYIGISVAD